MGRFAETVGGQFLQDTMYKPNAQMEMALAAQEVKSDALDKSFSTMGEYEGGATYKAWQEGYDKTLGSFNDSLNPIIEQLQKDAYNKDAIRALKAKTGEAKELFSSGELGMKSRIFKEDQAYISQKQQEISEEKNATKKGMMRQKLNDYRSETTRRVLGGYEKGFNLQGYSDYYDAQGAFKNKDSGIDVASQKFTREAVMNEDPVISVGGQLIRADMSKMGKNGKIMYNGQEYPVLTSGKSKLISLGLTDQFQTTTQKIEGYFQDNIAKQARTMLNNPAYISSLRDDYERFGHTQGYTTFEEYAKAKTDEEVNLFASQYNKETSNIQTKEDYKDVVAIDQRKQATKFHYAKKLQDAAAADDMQMAIANGTVVLTEKDLEMTQTRLEHVTSEQEVAANFDAWQELGALKYGEEDLTDTQVEQFANLNAVFAPLVGEFGEFIADAYGEKDQLAKMSEEGQMNYVMGKLIEMRKNENILGSSLSGVEYLARSAVQDMKKASAVDRVTKAREKMTKKFGSVKEFLAIQTKSEATYGSFTTEEQSYVYDAITNPDAYTSRDASHSTVTLFGKLTKKDSFNVGDKETGDPLSLLLAKAIDEGWIPAGSTLQDMGKAGMITPRGAAASRGRLNVNWTINDPRLLKQLTDADGGSVRSINTELAVPKEMFKGDTDFAKTNNIVFNAYTQQQGVDMSRYYKNVGQILGVKENFIKNGGNYGTEYPDGGKIAVRGLTNTTVTIDELGKGSGNFLILGKQKNSDDPSMTYLEINKKDYPAGTNMLNVVTTELYRLRFKEDFNAVNDGKRIKTRVEGNRALRDSQRAARTKLYKSKLKPLERNKEQLKKSLKDLRGSELKPYEINQQVPKIQAAIKEVDLKIEELTQLHKDINNL